jgi:Acyltransferase family.
MTINELQSKTIDYLRFPLILGVILIHSYSKNVTFSGVDISLAEGYPINYIVQNLFSRVIGMFCVPVFFFMSGFLFFLNCEIDFPRYKCKINNRIKTLLIPYLFWNLLVLFLYFVIQSIPFISTSFSVNQPLIKNYSFFDYINAFWGFDDGKPIAYQFWFIRDLFIVSLLTPLLKRIFSYFKYWGILSLGVIWYFNSLLIIPEYILTAFFFFSFGAYFSYNKMNFISFFRKYFVFFLVVYPIIAIIDLFTEGMIYNPYIHNLNILAGLIFSFNIVSFFIEKNVIHNRKDLSQASFFVFAMHEPLLAFIRKILFKFLSPNTEIILLVIYFAGMIITACIILFIYSYLKNYLPRILLFTTGKV